MVNFLQENLFFIEGLLQLRFRFFALRNVANKASRINELVVLPESI